MAHVAVPLGRQRVGVGARRQDAPLEAVRVVALRPRVVRDAHGGRRLGGSPTSAARAGPGAAARCGGRCCGRRLLLHVGLLHLRLARGRPRGVWRAFSRRCSGRQSGASPHSPSAPLREVWPGPGAGRGMWTHAPAQTSTGSPGSPAASPARGAPGLGRSTTGSWIRMRRLDQDEAVGSG